MAAAAAAAAVRSAVLSIDAGEAGEAPCYAGRPSRLPHSIESLVGRVQAGELDAAGFVEAVAAGRAGPLLRPAASLC
ncbi:hypothetical protein OEZ86_003142 [Tetradesmus obliquus]|nr:hypothetical protein OEZ86_003142 [Tetradesmus obliquus]